MLRLDDHMMGHVGPPGPGMFWETLMSDIVEVGQGRAPLAYAEARAISDFFYLQWLSSGW